MVLALTVNLSLSRHYDCNEAALQDVKPPFDGELLPQTAVFVERRGWFQWSRLIDVYEGGTEAAGEADSKRIGYFYDMNLLNFKRFGFSDAQDRIWFEGRYPSLLSRVKPYHEYELRRCDAPRDEGSTPQRRDADETRVEAPVHGVARAHARSRHATT